MKRKAAVFTADAARRIATATRRVEGQLLPATFGRPSMRRNVTADHNAWVRITSTSLTSGRYPGVWCEFATDGMLVDMATVWVREVRGGKLQTVDGAGALLYYFARGQGYAADGVEIFVPVVSESGLVTVTGTTDYGTSSTAGTSPTGVLSLPTLTGTSSAPSWTPAANTYPVEWNQTSDTLYAWNGSTWVAVAGGTATVAQVLNVSTSATSTTTPALTQTMTSTGTPAAGFGLSDPVKLTPTSGGAVQVANTSYQFTTTAASGTYNATVTNQITDHTATSAYFTVVSTAGSVVNTVGGQLAFGTTGSTGTPTGGRLVLPVMTTSGPPTYASPIAGEVVVDSDGVIWEYDGSGWVSQAGSGTISGLTTNALPKAASSTTLTDSGITDSGTDVTITGETLTVTGGNLIAKPNGSDQRLQVTNTQVVIDLGTGSSDPRFTADATGIGFYGASTVAQYSTTGTVTGFTGGAGSTAKSDSTYTGNSGSTAYTVGDIVRALKLLGLIAT